MSVILTEGSRVSGDKIKETGFSFEFDTLEPAFQDLLD